MIYVEGTSGGVQRCTEKGERKRRE